MKKVTTKIIHIPYLEFTGNETSLINIAPITTNPETILEMKCSNIDWYKENFNNTIRGFFGLQSNNSDQYSPDYNVILAGYSYGYTNAMNCLFPFTRLKNITNWEDLEDDYIFRINKYGMYLNGLFYKREFTNGYLMGECYIPAFELGGCCHLSVKYVDQPEKAFRAYRYVGYLHYFRIERKNSLYKHYLPCVRFYNIVNDNNELISENNIDYGFFESVNQDYYIADSNSIPTHTGDTLNEDYSNLLDINGNVINI